MPKSYDAKRERLLLQQELTLPVGFSWDDSSDSGGSGDSTDEEGFEPWTAPAPHALSASQILYFAVPDDVYRYKCEALAADSPPAQGCGFGLFSEVSSLSSVLMQSADERLETCSSEDEEAEDFAVSEGVVTRVSNFVSNRDWRMVEHVWYRWLNFYHDSWPRRFVGRLSSEDEDTSDSDGDLPVRRLRTSGRLGSRGY